MRSYSTLLMHILGSHEEISGYTEAKLSYRGPMDLFQLRCTSQLDGNFKQGCTYVVDKILHDGFRLSDGIILDANIMFIFVIRKPREALKSMMKMEMNREKGRGRQEEGYMKPGTPEHAMAYYVPRLESLSGLARRINRLGRTPFLLEAERLVEEPRAVLEQLGQRLQLRTQLNEKYSVFDLTGESGRGDMSTYIRSGAIQPRRSDYPDIEIPEFYLQRAELEYDRCLQVLKENCGPLIARN
jgi:hypothetical protein